MSCPVGFAADEVVVILCLAAFGLGYFGVDLIAVLLEGFAAARVVIENAAGED